MISCESEFVDSIESILQFAPRTFSEVSIVKVVFSALIIGWVKPHDTLRPVLHLDLRSRCGPRATRKEWLPPSWASGTLSQFPVQTINLALRWVIGFTRWDQSDTVCSVSVCPSVRRLAPVLPTFCVVSSFIPSAPDVYVVSVHRNSVGIPVFNYSLLVSLVYDVIPVIVEQ